MVRLTEKRLIQIQEAGKILETLFPRCFIPKGEQAKPLKVGIDKDLLNNDDHKISKRAIKRYLGTYIAREDYIESMQIGTVRVDLNGNDAGVVNEEAHQLAIKAKEDIKFCIKIKGDKMKKPLTLEQQHALIDKDRLQLPSHLLVIAKQLLATTP